MSYLVLARKYRPGSFADIVGQEHVVRTLENAIRLERVHHAFLFTGARGVGKTTTARALARALNCAKGPTATPCGECPPCVEIAAGSSPDVLEIDGASNTGVDNVRELRENVRYLPNRGRFKLYIIDEVHMLSQAAFNALLKTLEEPPPHVKFIFATTEPHKIPVTILSRCQRFDFRRVSAQGLAEHLRSILEREGVTLGAGALNAIVREAQGSVRDALSLLDQVLSYAGDSPEDEHVLEALGVVDRQTIFELCGAVLERDADAILRLVGEVDARGHDLSDVAGLFVEHLRDLMVAKVVDKPSESLLDRSPSEVEALGQQASRVERTDLHRLFSLAVTVAEDVNRSTHPRVTLEMGLLRLLEVEPSQSLASLLVRLDELVGGSGAVTASAPRRAATAESEPRPDVSATSAGVDAPSSVSETASSPSTVPGAPGNAAWDRLVERVRERRPAMASVLEHGRVIAFSPEGVRIGFPAGTFYWEKARDTETREALGAILVETFGQPVALTLEAVEGADEEAPESIAEKAERERQQRLREIRTDAVEHPAVQSATRILGGQIKKVTPLVD